MNYAHRFRYFISLLLLCVTGLSPSAAADDCCWLDRDDALMAAQSATLKSYPDAQTVIVDSATKVTYQTDGTYTHWDETYIRILTEEARRNYSTLSSYFTIPYQRGPEDCAIALVEIIRPDGSSVRIDVAKQSKIMINPGGMEANIYNPNSKIIQVNIPDLNVGDVLHYVMYDNIVHARMQDTWCDWITFEGTSPIIKSSVEITAPKDFPLQRIALKAPVKDTVTFSQIEKDQTIVYRWVARDVPRMFPEPNMPSPYTVVQRLLVSTVKDWPTISRWYWNLVKPHLAVTPQIKAQVAACCADAEDDQTRIEALFQFVSQQIRYMGITVEAEAPGYEPHDVAETFDARHGVCRDKAALLVAMLREAGFDAFPALINVGPLKDEEVPQPYFNHAIVAVRMPDGAYQLMDPTDENTRQLLPAYLNHRSYLVATPDGDSLRVSPVTPSADNMLYIRTTGELQNNDSLRLRTELRFEGINDNAYRGWFASITPDERRQFVDTVAKRVLPGALVESFRIEPEDLMDTTKELSITMDYRVDSYPISGKNCTALLLPLVGTRVGMVNFIIGKTGLAKRNYPLVTEIACGVSESIRIQLPETLTDAVLPTSPATYDGALAFSSSVLLSNTTLMADSSFILNDVEFSPDQYLQLKGVLKEMERVKKQMSIFQQADRDAFLCGADAVVEDEKVDFVLHDSHSWTETRTIRKRILSYAGKKDHAELKFDFNPAMESVAILSAETIQPDGTRQAISEEEINVMDQQWAGTASRYPAGKTLVASLPGVEIGSVMEYTVQRMVTNRPIFSVYESFQDVVPVLEKSVLLHIPENITLNEQGWLFEENKLSLTRLDTMEAGRMRSLSWSGSHIPAIKEEQDMPPEFCFTAGLFLSTGDWSSYAAMLNKRLVDASMDQPESELLGRRLASENEDAAAVLQAIRDYVAIHIRTVELSMDDIPLESITAADKTLIDGYGSPSDKAILLQAMLRGAGIASRYLLVADVPDLSSFTNPLHNGIWIEPFKKVVVAMDDFPLDGVTNGTIYLSGQDRQYDALGSSGEQDRLALTLPAGNFTRIRPLRPDAVHEQFTSTLHPDGSISMQCTKTYFGDDYGDEKTRFAEFTPEDRSRYYQEMVAEISQSATAESDLLTDFSGYPGTVSFSVFIMEYATLQSPFLYMTLPASLERFLDVHTPQRSNPLYVKTARDKTIQHDITLPDYMSTVVQPLIYSVDRTALSDVQVSITSRDVSDDDVHKTKILYRASMPPAVVSPENFSALVRVDNRLANLDERLLMLQADPSGSDLVDYADTNNWIQFDISPDKPYDVFFVHPTTYFSTEDGMNVSLKNTEINAVSEEEVGRQGSVFAPSCNIFAPRYRQASMAVLGMDEATQTKYLSKGLQDVHSAFEYYLKNENKGRPFILAGHSQGSNMLLWLMQQYPYLIDPDQLIAAYIIGWTVTDADAAGLGLPVASTPDQTGVIISWNTMNKGSHPPTLLSGARCVNPLSWSTNTLFQPAELNSGARVVLPSGVITNVAHFTSAQIDASGGLVIPPTMFDSQFSFGMGPGVYHGYDYDFFYSNLVENVAVRCNAWTKKQQSD